jgi:hypothetical protein
VLNGVEICEAALLPMSEIPCPATLLPPNLNVQMDNVVGDNKNWFVFYFWSFLVTKGIFKEVDALFGRWSMSLKKENFPAIPLLMKFFMEVESVPTIPHLIKEVPDFKDFIVGHIVDEDEALEGHTKLNNLSSLWNPMVVP